MPLLVLLLCVAGPLVAAGSSAQEGRPAVEKRDTRFLRTVAHDVDIPRVEGSSERERIMVDLAGGVVECRVEDDAKETRVAAEFTVDGIDAADAERRVKLVKLFAERAGDGTIVVDAVFPGGAMALDAVKVTIVAPPTQELVLKSASGAVRAKATTGSLRTSTKSGAIVVEGHRGPIDARAASGRIEITGAHESVQATSASGSIQVSLADDNDQPFDLESRSGAIRVEVGPRFDGAVRLASSSGVLSLIDAGKRARVPQQTNTRLIVEIGAAAGQSKVETTSGAATIVVR